MLDHPIISGSTYAQARLCSGFPWLNRLPERRENEWTRGGTILHQACAASLSGNHDPSGQFSEYARIYADTLNIYAPTWKAEHRCGDDICGGTIDAISAHGEYIVDLKTGTRRQVRADDWQLKFYAAVHKAEGGGKLAVYQPTFYGLKLDVYEYTSGELAEWKADVSETYARVTRNPTLTPGQHCDDCKARKFCLEQKPKKQPKPAKASKACDDTPF